MILDGDRLRQARGRAGLSQRQLARDAGIARTTIGDLERQNEPRCHFRTRGRIAAALGTHPKAITAPGDPMAGAVLVASSPGNWAPELGESHGQTFPARADQVRLLRSFLRILLAGSPVADAALLVCSELAANAVQHSGSARPGGEFTVRVQVRADAWAWIEVQDEGGRWTGRKLGAEERGRGLVVVDELADWWDIREDESSRVVCVRLDWPRGA